MTSKNYVLGDLIEVKHGFAFSGEHFSNDHAFPQLVTPGNFRIGGGFVEARTKTFTGDIPSEYKLQPGDVIVTMTDLSKKGDTLGYSAKVPNGGTYLHNQRIGKVVNKRPELVSLDFVSWFMRTAGYRNSILGSASGTAVKHTSPSRIMEVELLLPPLSVQNSIAEFMDSIELKIQQNVEIANLMERITASFFKSWFIDFDPVKAKMAREAPVAMDAETAALFPDSMEESEIGEIPAGWSVGTLANFFNLVMGQSPPGSAYNSEGVGEPFFQGRAEFGERFPTQRLSSTLGNRRAAKGDVLVSVRAPVGDQNQALVDCIIGRGLAAIRHESGSQAYSYEFVRSIQSQLDFFNGQGSVFGSISKRDFESIQVLEPPDALIQAFDLICSPIDGLLRNLHIQNKSLAATRDALLPRLISGELEMPEEMLAT